MQYDLFFMPKAEKDIKSLDPGRARQVMGSIWKLRDNLNGDVKKLTNFTPEYRLRVGVYRVLFEVDGGRVVVYRVRHRKDVYRK